MTAVPLSGILLLGLLTLCWGGNWPAMKLAVAEIPPWTFRSVCLVVGGSLLLALARLRGDSLAVPRAERGPLLCAALFNITAWQLCSAYALTLMQAGRASIIAFTMPLWAVLLERVLFGEKVPPAKAAALGLGLVGLAVLIGSDVALMAAAPAGALFILAAAIAWAIGTLVLKRHRWTIPTTALTAWQVVLGSVPVVVGMVVFERSASLGRPSTGALVALAYATVVGIVLAHYLWFYLVRLLPPAVAAIGVLGVPVVGVLSSALLVGEAIGAREVAALLCVVPALALVLVGPELARLIERRAVARAPSRAPRDPR